MVCVISAFSAVHQMSKLREARVLNIRLNERLARILNEKEKLQEELNQAEEELVKLRLSLEEKERAINQMGNANLLRESLIDARERIQQLNQSLNQIKHEKTALEDSNLDMSNRLKNSTQELIRVVEDLKLSQNQLKDMEKTQVLPLKERIDELNKFRQEKNQELSRLEEELVRLEELESALAQKEKRIKYLESELAQKDDYQTDTLYGSAKGQIKRLSEILISKELELDKSRKELLDSKEELNRLQARIVQSEEDLQKSQLSQDEIKKLEAEKFSMEYRLREAQVELAQKEGLIGSLENELESLNQEIAKQEQEKELITSRLARTDLGRAQAEDKLTQQAVRLEEINFLYQDLKNQINQISEVLAEKELELNRREEEVAFLKEEVVILNSRSARMEKELAEAKERQQKTMDDLVAAMSLNAALQERLADTHPSSESRLSGYDIQDKREAEEFRRKIEVFLEPEG